MGRAHLAVRAAATTNEARLNAASVLLAALQIQQVSRLVTHAPLARSVNHWVPKAARLAARVDFSQSGVPQIAAVAKLVNLLPRRQALRALLAQQVLSRLSSGLILPAIASAPKELMQTLLELFVSNVLKV